MKNINDTVCQSQPHDSLT